MLITKEYGYRTDYSKVEIKCGQSIVVEDNLPAKIIFAENLLLGLRVRLLVSLEVLESGLFETKETAIAEFETLLAMTRKTAIAISDMCKPTENSSDTPYEYSRLHDFTTEMKFISNMIKNALHEIDPEEYAELKEVSRKEISPIRI